MKKYFRLLGFIEAISLLVLFFIAMPMKYLAGIPLAVKIVGTVHGLLFIAYVCFAAVTASEIGWSARKILLSYVIASIPFGPFILDKRLFSDDAA